MCRVVALHLCLSYCIACLLFRIACLFVFLVFEQRDKGSLLFYLGTHKVIYDYLFPLYFAGNLRRLGVSGVRRTRQGVVFRCCLQGARCLYFILFRFSWVPV